MVDVKVIGPTDRVLDLKYLMIVYGNQAMIVDAHRGSTRIVPLDHSLSSDGEASAAAILESAKRKAEVEGIPVVYVVDHSKVSRAPMRLQD